ncbi:MAG: carotenoid oxygenase family protein [Acidimicrobiales bacterium]
MTDTAAHLADNYAPVDTESTTHDLHVTGSLPPELNGRLLRIGPNPVSGDRGHWFAGEGMVHGVRLHNGAAQWYRNRYVRSDRVTEAMQWPQSRVHDTVAVMAAPIQMSYTMPEPRLRLSRVVPIRLP